MDKVWKAVAGYVGILIDLWKLIGNLKGFGLRPKTKTVMVDENVRSLTSDR